MASKTRSVGRDDLEQNGFYWVKHPGREPFVAKLAGQVSNMTYYGSIPQIVWVYCAPGMMGGDSVMALPADTKFNGPIKKPAGW